MSWTFTKRMYSGRVSRRGWRVVKRVPEPHQTPDWVPEEAPYSSHDRAYHYPNPIQHLRPATTISPHHHTPPPRLWLRK